MTTTLLIPIFIDEKLTSFANKGGCLFSVYCKKLKTSDKVNRVGDVNAYRRYLHCRDGGRNCTMGIVVTSIADEGVFQQNSCSGPLRWISPKAFLEEIPSF